MVPQNIATEKSCKKSDVGLCHGWSEMTMRPRVPVTCLDHNQCNKWFWSDGNVCDGDARLILLAWSAITEGLESGNGAGLSIYSGTSNHREIVIESCFWVVLA